MSGSIVAVLGLSGAGKTTIVSKFVEHYPWAYSVSAGSLLKDAMAVTDSEELRTAMAAGIYSNQGRLVAAFRELRCRHPNLHIIFDGHSLIDNDHGLVVVPTETFRQIAPDLIIFLEEDPDVIASRRVADKFRSRPIRNAKELAKHQAIAKEAALEYGRSLSVECRVIASSDHHEFEKIILEKVGGKGS